MNYNRLDYTICTKCSKYNSNRQYCSIGHEIWYMKNCKNFDKRTLKRLWEKNIIHKIRFIVGMLYFALSMLIAILYLFIIPFSLIKDYVKRRIS
jgi:hypothetical protein